MMAHDVECKETWAATKWKTKQITLQPAKQEARVRYGVMSQMIRTTLAHHKIIKS